MNVWMIDPLNNTPFYNADLCRALQEKDVDLTMITAPFIYDPWPIYHNVMVNHQFSRFLKTRWGKKLATKPKIRRLLRAMEYPIDLFSLFSKTPRPKPLLHFQWAIAPALDAHLWQILKRAGYSIVYTAHDIIPHGAQQAPLGLQSLYALADRIIVHSPILAADLQKLAPNVAEKIRIVPLGVGLGNVPEVPQPEARQTLGLSQETAIALFFGLIEPYKGVAILIQAFARVVAELPQARLIIAGKANMPTQPYQSLISQLGLEKVIDTRFEFIPTQQLPAYYGAADVVVLPYLEASQSAALLTAYRYGKAVIVTQVGSLADTVTNGQNGLVIPPNDEDALATALIDILANRSRATEMGHHSQNLGLERHHWADIAHQTIAVYHELL